MRRAAKRNGPVEDTLPSATVGKAPLAANPAVNIRALQRSAGNAGVTQLLQRVRADGGSPRREDRAAPDLESGTPRTDRSNPRGPLAAAGLLDSIQRSVDEKPSSGHAAAWSIQRAPTEDSNPTLAHHYNAMMSSSVFQDLDRAASEHGPIRLVDSSASGIRVYHHHFHSIYLPADLPTGELRASLLFEMQHAADRESGQTLLDQHRQATASLAADAPHLLPKQRAAQALAIEWIEWCRIAAAHYRTRKVADDLGENQISISFPRSFATPGEGWFKFEEFLREQIKTRHTAEYDRDSKRSSWVGKEIMSQVLSTDPGAFVITEDEVDSFRSGARTRFKDPSDNPFSPERLTFRDTPAAAPVSETADAAVGSASTSA